MSGEHELKIPALGRPFKLGSLYDRRRDMRLPGIKSLWDLDNLLKDSTLTEQNNCMFEVLAGSTFKDGCDAFEMDSELSLSFLCGMVSVSGSANYLKEKTTSTQKSRVSLKYFRTSSFEEASRKYLDPEHILYKDALTSNDATHVVVSILYGAQAFFLFESEKEESTQAVKQKLAALAKGGTPLAGGSASGAVNMDEEEKEMSESIHCKYYGDIDLPTNPTNYTEAMEIYKNLPTLYSDDKAIPITVWLYPLSKLAAEARSPHIYQTIGGDLVRQVEYILESFSNIVAESEQMKKQESYKKFSAIKHNVNDFHKLVSNYSSTFKEELQPIIYKIRDGSAEDGDLLKQISNMEKSPFQLERLQRWVKHQTDTMKTIDGYLQSLSSPRIEITPDKSHLSQVITGNNKVACLRLKLGQTPDAQIATMKSGVLPPESNQQRKVDEDEDDELYDDSTSRLMIGIREFLDYMQQNCKRPVIKFLVYTSNSSKPSTDFRIYIYKQGVCLDKAFHPPQPPANLRVEEVERNAMTLVWDVPISCMKDISSFRILWRKGKDRVWKHKNTSGTSMSYCFTNLDCDSTYSFKVAANLAVGRSGDSRKFASTTLFLDLPIIGPWKGSFCEPVGEEDYSTSPRQYSDGSDSDSGSGQGHGPVMANAPAAAPQCPASPELPMLHMDMPTLPMPAMDELYVPVGPDLPNGPEEDDDQSEYSDFSEPDDDVPDPSEDAT